MITSLVLQGLKDAHYVDMGDGACDHDHVCGYDDYETPPQHDDDGFPGLAQLHPQNPAPVLYTCKVDSSYLFRHQLHLVFSHKKFQLPEDGHLNKVL